MSRIKRTKSSASLIVAVVALVAALGGGAVAGVAVTSLNKKEKEQVKKIAKRQAKKAVKGIPAGPKGDKGDPGATNVTARLGPGSPLVDAGEFTSDTALCEPGEVATGGGYFLTGNATWARVYNNTSQDTTGWSVSVANDDDASASVGVRARVTCAAP